MEQKWKFRFKGDRTMLTLYGLFILVSIIFVFTSIGKLVYTVGDNSVYPLLLKHLGLIFVGVVACYVSYKIKYKYYSAPIVRKLLYITSIILLLAAFALSGGKTASRWIVLPGIGQLQGSEIAKYLLILYTSSLLAINRETIKTWDTFKKIGIPVLVISALIFLENFSTSMLVFAVCAALMIIGRVNMKYMSIILVALLLLIVGVVMVTAKSEKLRSSTAIHRVQTFIENDKTIIDQPNIARMAIATGGVSGKGIGRTEEARFLSESHNDFIFAIILEETGFLGALFVVFLYLYLILRIMYVASRKANGFFGKFVALGIGFMFAFQALMNMMVATHMAPVTGQTLPFISYGGTSFVFASFALGIVLNISKGEGMDAKDEEAEEQDDEQQNKESKSQEGSKDKPTTREKLENRIKEAYNESDN